MILSPSSVHSHRAISTLHFLTERSSAKNSTKHLLSSPLRCSCYISIAIPLLRYIIITKRKNLSACLVAAPEQAGASPLASMWVSTPHAYPPFFSASSLFSSLLIYPSNHCVSVLCSCTPHCSHALLSPRSVYPVVGPADLSYSRVLSLFLVGTELPVIADSR